MTQNFPNYIKLEGEQTFNILEEFKELKFKKKKNTLVQCYSTFTSSTLYRLLMKEFPFPSLSLLKKINERQLDAAKCAKSLKSQGVISKDVVLMFDERY